MRCISDWRGTCWLPRRSGGERAGLRAAGIRQDEVQLMRVLANSQALSSTKKACIVIAASGILD
jgi:hypothetical protein